MPYRIEPQEVTRLANICVAATCDNCGKDLESVFEDSYYQPKDALDIHLSGGYGQYIDGSSTVIFCKECADRLIEAFPALMTDFSYD